MRDTSVFFTNTTNRICSNISLCNSAYSDPTEACKKSNQCTRTLISCTNRLLVYQPVNIPHMAPGTYPMTPPAIAPPIIIPNRVHLDE